MRSTFFGLNTLLRALQAQQQALDTTNHNIANANTDGYSRQQVSLTATQPFTTPSLNRPGSMPLHLGTGVVVGEIRRQRDTFVDLELRQQLQQHARWETVAAGLGEIEAMFAEPGDLSLRTLVSGFFNAWGDLANNPQSGAARTAVRSMGEALAQAFNDLGRRLASARESAGTAVALHVPEINDLGNRLAALNAQIANAVAAGDTPNDFLDERDRVLDQLVTRTGATYRQDARGHITVTIGDRAFVTGDRVNHLVVEPRNLPGGTQLYDVKWALDFSPVRFSGGELAGLVELRDTAIPQQIRQLDLLASTIAGAINDVHRGGYGTGAYANRISNFFDPATATPLAQTGLATDLVPGTITVGATTITVDPASQSIDDVMGQIVAAINASPGVTAPATWRLDPASGAISLTYQSATPVMFGGSGDTSNLLELLGLRGAADVITDPLTNDRLVSGTAPVALFSAAHLRLDAAIRNDILAIAAAAGASAGLTEAIGPGDNRNALAMGALQLTAFAALNGFTFEGFYAMNTAGLGAQTRQAESTAAIQGQFVEHLKARRESLSGVSLDEEATQLIRYQRAYQAAARGISALDEMLETIITRMGRVGN